MNKSKKYLIVAVFFICLLSIPLTIYANSAEPPSLIIIVNNPPEDLSIVMISNESEPVANTIKTAWEGYYLFYSVDMQANDDYTFRVETNSTSFECTFSEPLRKYNEVLTLDLSNQELKYGEYQFRSVILVLIRLILTLLIEGFIFWLFGFRSKRSWIFFIAINLLTQGALNILLNLNGSPLPNYLIISLLFGEFFVFLIEMIGLPLLITEKKKLYILLYAFVANLISLILGGFLISVLPV